MIYVASSDVEFILEFFEVKVFGEWLVKIVKSGGT